MKLFFTLFIFLLMKLSSVAQAGFPDKSFSDNGIMIDKNFLGGTPGMSVQSDGKYVICIDVIGRKFSILRYNTDGKIDSIFGDNGAVTPVFNSTSSSCADIAVQADTKILACGTANHSGVNNIALARYTIDGSLDLSFGKEGTVDFNIEPFVTANATAMEVQLDGKIVVVGNCNKGINGSYIPFITRFDSHGNIDKTFGTGGIVFMEDNGSTATSVAIRKDGEIMVGGTYAYLYDPKFMIAAYLPNGNSDSLYGSNGVATYSFGEQVYAELNSIVLQEDEKIVCGGYARDLGSQPLILSQMAVVRFNYDGSTDSTLGDEGGLIFTLEGGSAIQTILLQKDGKIVGAGNINESTDSSQFAMVRFMPDGRVDSSFGSSGVSVASISNASYCNDALLDKDNKIVLSGSSYKNGDEVDYLTLARYNNDPLSKKQILIAKIRRWWQHHNGISWDNMPNIKNYAVQHSNNGMNWNTIFSSRRSAGNQQSMSSYADPSPLPGTNYYRLQTTSVDGAVAYSNVIAIGDENSSISLSPNPAKNVLQISGLSSSVKTKIMVVDLSGNMAISPKLITNRTSTYNLNIATLKPGNYMLRIESNGVVVTKQFVKE
jgi:uncharacterized delta-60 repeat protein